MTLEQRNKVVVTAVADDAGGEHVLSHFGDSVWDLSPEIAAKNRSARDNRINWPSDVPQALVDDAKAAVYCALRQGRFGRSYSASSAVTVGVKCKPTLRFLASLGVTTFSGVRSLYVADLIASFNDSLSPREKSQRLTVLDLVWSFEHEMLRPLPEHPFAGKSLNEVVGGNDDQDDPAGRTGKTPVIPPSVQRTLWEHCEAVLREAESVFTARDAGEIEATSNQLLALRDAALYQLQITSGMRNSESTGVTSGCWRCEERTVPSGRKTTFHWVKTIEVKTTGGREVDFLVPPEIFHSLEILQRYAEPLQRRLSDEARWLEGLLGAGDEAISDGTLTNGMKPVDAIQRLNHVREIAKHMLLTLSQTESDHRGSGSRVEVMSSRTCVIALKRLALAAGSDWNAANHQCRRTFAWNVANSRLGRMGLVFIKWQLKHASISWTQLYAANPRQDQALYEEFAQAMYESKVALIESWNNFDARLSGVAGKKLMQTRATPARNVSELLAATAESTTLRSTGHAWCMSGTRVCHGQGVYDPTMCGGGCSQALIDESQGARWQMIHLDNLRLAAITDCGPAIKLKAQRAIETSNQVLADLGVPLPTREQARAYANGTWIE
ncbi:tyrosine-type recombinase/integrase [Ralstonia pseudosolanacearum]|uniref:tyrosine-type recombinase/integrase n=1 Tax=Ralstonia pseudosolanacearum TaxID=1310165 RepID=UPI001E38D688|nr:tyrosine-type recombinase/integrase [Ralstonia pseudosolanacearum]